MRKRTVAPFFVCLLMAIAPAALAQVTVSDFSVSKTGPATASQGTDVTFNVVVTNNGPDPGLVTMNDVIANGWIFQSVSAPAGFSCSSPAVGATSGTVSCTNAAMAVGSATIQITLQIPDSAGPEASFSNTATVLSASDPNGGNNSSTATTTTPPSTDITVLKFGPSQANAGTDVAFTVTVTNLGPSNATTGVTMTDPVVSGWSFVSVTPPAGWSCSDPGAGATSGTVSCNTASMASGASADFTIVFHIPAQTPNGTLFTNTASVASQFDSSTENNSSTAVTATPPPPLGDMSIDKSGPASAPPNSDVTYTITVTNGGPDAATNVSWTDTLPAGFPGGAQMTFVSFQQTSGPTFNCGVPSTTTTCTIGTLPAGATATFNLVGHIPSGTAAGAEFSNKATVTADNDPNSENNTGATALEVANSDVSVVKSAPATAIAGGPTFDYVITVSNGGPNAAQGVGFTDPLPPGVLFVSLTQDTGPAATCNTPVGNGTVTCSISVLTNGQSAQFTITVQVDGSVANGTLLTNTANASSTTFDSNTNNNSSSVSTTVIAQADVSIVKSGPATVIAGTDITYTVTVTNSGPSPAFNVSWTDTLPAGSTFGSLTQNTGPTFTCTGGSTISCSIATLNAGASASFTIHMLVSPAAPNGSTLSNTATVTSSNPPDPTANNSSTVNSTVNTQADLSLTKSAPSAASAGTNMTYHIEVLNNGSSVAQNVSWTDTLPANTTFVSLNQTLGPVAACTTGPVVSCSTASLVVGGVIAFDLTVQIAPATPNGTVISNTATASTTTTDPNTANNSATAMTTVATTADLGVTKSGPASTPSNTNVTYTVVVSNAGPSTAANVTLTETVPTGMTFVSVNQSTGPVFSCNGTGPIVCTIATFASGASATFQFTFNVPPGAAAGTNATDTATVAATTADPNTANNTASVATVIGASIPALSTLAMMMLALALGALALVALRR